MDEIKRSFNEIKSDLDFFNHELINLKEEMNNIKEGFEDIYKILNKFEEKFNYLSDLRENPTSTHIKNVPTETEGSSTHHPSFKPLNTQNMGISMGNQGASTDRQTDRQTDNSTQNKGENTEISPENTIDSAAEIIDSLDNIKKQIRLKFKKLTNQEMLVFSTIYQFDEEKGFSNYKMLAERLNLTESSIRDYVGRLIKKQAPIEKHKANNKEIELNISKNLKKITSLNTILKLREL